MRKLIANLLVIIVVILGVGIAYYTIKAYFMVVVGDGYYYDGWGRMLYEPPWWVKWLWPDMQWPGLKYFIMDTVGFWILIGICAGLIKISAILRDKQ